MRSTRLLVKRLEEIGVYTTDNPNHAIYLLPDGVMIDGNFCDGMRGEDHRCIFGALNYGSYYEVTNQESFWKRLHREYRIVRLVPESKVALVKGRQQLTPLQRRFILENGYTIERY